MTFCIGVWAVTSNINTYIFFVGTTWPKLYLFIIIEEKLLKCCRQFSSYAKVKIFTKTKMFKSPVQYCIYLICGDIILCIRWGFVARPFKIPS